MPRRLTILALGSQGDVQPYAALGRGLRDAGYQVRLVTFASFAALAEKQGLDFHPVPGDAQALVNMMMAGDSFGSRNPLRLMQAIRRSYAQLVNDYIHAFSADELRDSDAVLNQLPGGIFGRDLAEKLRVPHINLSVIPLTPTRAFPNPLLTTQSVGVLNPLTYNFAAQMLWALFRGSINRFRRQLGLSSTSLFFPKTVETTINGFSSQVVPPPADWGEHIHTTGYWLLDESGWQPPADLETFLNAGEPPVFIGFGSMVTGDAAALTQTVIEGVHKSGHRAVLSSGWAGLGAAELPATIFHLGYTPYSWLFPRCAGVIHHGGSGTTGLGLRAGVPGMIVPFGADQPYWGKRLVELGVGINPIPIKRLTADNLAAAIQQLTSHAGLKQRAADLGQRLQTEDGIGTAITHLRRLVGSP